MKMIVGLLCLFAVLVVEAEEMNILMVGNSYTMQSWTVLRDFLAADPAVEASITLHASGGKKLFQFVEDEELLKLLSGDKKWDFVVLQDQSQLPALAFNPDLPDVDEDRAAFDAGGPRLIEIIHRLHPQAQIILFETWARHPGPEKWETLAKWFDNDPDVMMKYLAEAYRSLVKRPGPDGWDHSAYVRLAPVGDAFHAWYKLNGYGYDSKKLHKTDNSHPGPLGGYLTGAVFYETLTGRKSADVSYTGGLEKVLADGLKEVAAQTVEAERERVSTSARR
jgi:hypothetical protein